MLRRARILLALFVLSALCTTPALLADDTLPTPPPAGENPNGGHPDGDDPDLLALLLGLLGLGDEFNPQHLPGG